MEHALRFVIVFLWCVCFGFFSVMGYLDDTMTSQKLTAILAGLLAGAGVYCAIEWRPKIKGWPSLRARWNERRLLYAKIFHSVRAGLPLCARILQRVRTYLTSLNLPAWSRIKKRFLPASKPSISSKST